MFLKTSVSRVLIRRSLHISSLALSCIVFCSTSALAATKYIVPPVPATNPSLESKSSPALDRQAEKVLGERFNPNGLPLCQDAKEQQSGCLLITESLNDGEVVLLKVPYIAGAREGLALIYDAESKLLNASHFKQDVLCGVAKEFYPNGKLKFVENFNSGFLDGKQEYYSEDGALKYTLEYKEGKLLSGKCANSRELSEAELDSYKFEGKEPDCQKLLH